MIIFANEIFMPFNFISGLYIEESYFVICYAHLPFFIALFIVQK